MNYRPYQKLEMEFFNGIKRKVQKFPSGTISWVVVINGVYTNIRGEEIDGKFHPFKEEHRNFIENSYSVKKHPINVESKKDYIAINARRYRLSRDILYQGFSREIETSKGIRKVSIYHLHIHYDGKKVKVKPNFEKKRFEIK